MRWHEAYYDSITETWRVIAKDDDGYFFNVIPDAGDEETAKQTAGLLNSRKAR